MIPTTNNTPADSVIGQTNFTSGNFNGGVARGANTLTNPFNLFADEFGLYIADAGNKRVLVKTLP